MKVNNPETKRYSVSKSKHNKLNCTHTTTHADRTPQTSVRTTFQPQIYIDTTNEAAASTARHRN